jgi:hypothetical protein
VRDNRLVEVHLAHRHFAVFPAREIVTDNGRVLRVCCKNTVRAAAGPAVFKGVLDHAEADTGGDVDLRADPITEAVFEYQQVCQDGVNAERVFPGKLRVPIKIKVDDFVIGRGRVLPAKNITFAAALKSFLRQDPDVIMIGEIRDLETADIAIKAAQTGHMVLSTLHTNDAPTTITRLANMGVKPFNIASSVILITAQRLARRLCTCKVPVSIPPARLKEAGFTDADLAEKFQLYGPNTGNPSGG